MSGEAKLLELGLDKQRSNIRTLRDPNSSKGQKASAVFSELFPVPPARDPVLEDSKGTVIVDCPVVAGHGHHGSVASLGGCVARHPRQWRAVVKEREIRIVEPSAELERE